jgi:hypothetical protein
LVAMGTVAVAACVSPRGLPVNGAEGGVTTMPQLDGAPRDAPTDPSVPRCEGSACGTCLGCSAPQNADPTCMAGVCGFACRDGFRKCGTECFSNAVQCGGQCLPGWVACGSLCVQGTCCDDSQCGACQKCEAGACRNQDATEDRKSECGAGPCRTGTCDGKGHCDVRESGPDPAGMCQKTDCRTGMCGAGGACQLAADEQPGPGCMGTCQLCRAGVCKDVGPLITCYRDSDGDSWGDKSDTNKQCATCTGGYVANSLDCYDRNKLAHPPDSQEQPYQDKDRGDGSFDYDCDGKITKNPFLFWDTCTSRVGNYCAIPSQSASTADLPCGTIIPDYYCRTENNNGTCVARNEPVRCL